MQEILPSYAIALEPFYYTIICLYHAVLGCALDRLNGLTEDPKKDQFPKLNFGGKFLLNVFMLLPNRTEDTFFGTSIFRNSLLLVERKYDNFMTSSEPKLTTIGLLETKNIKLE